MARGAGEAQGGNIDVDVTAVGAGVHLEADTPGNRQANPAVAGAQVGAGAIAVGQLHSQVAAVRAGPNEPSHVTQVDVAARRRNGRIPSAPVGRHVSARGVEVQRSLDTSRRDVPAGSLRDEVTVHRSDGDVAARGADVEAPPRALDVDMTPRGAQGALRGDETAVDVAARGMTGEGPCDLIKAEMAAAGLDGDLPFQVLQRDVPAASPGIQVEPAGRVDDEPEVARVATEEP